jgi:hypothetical protein
MASALPRGFVVPNPGPPKTIGILYFIFGTLLLLYGLCQIGAVMILPGMSRWMLVQQKQAQAQMEAQQKQTIDAEIAELETKAKAEGATDAEKEAIKAEIERLKQRPKVPMINTMMGLEIAQDKRVQVFNWLDMLTCLVVNVPLLVSGIALIQLREWGRKLALWTCGIKIARLAALGLFAIIAIVPMMTRRMTTEMDKMGAQIQASRGGPGGGPPIQQQMRFVGGLMGAAMTGTYIVIYAGGMIYPVIAIWALSRPRAKAACIAAKPAAEPEIPL